MSLGVKIREEMIICTLLGQPPALPTRPGAANILACQGVSWWCVPVGQSQVSCLTLTLKTPLGKRLQGARLCVGGKGLRASASSLWSSWGALSLMAQVMAGSRQRQGIELAPTLGEPDSPFNKVSNIPFPLHFLSP